MILGPGDVREELRAVARDRLANDTPRWRHGEASGASPGGVDEAGWRDLADLGWLGLEVPEPLGGAGATFREVAVLLEEMGRVLWAGPFVGTVVMGVGALLMLEPSPERDALLRRVSAGEAVVAVATGSPWAAPPFRLSPGPGAPTVGGEATFVVDATAADVLLLVAADPDGCPVVVVAEASDPGVAVAGQPLLDTTRAVGTVRAEALRVSGANLWRFGEAVTAPERLRTRGALAVALDSAGVAGAMLEATVAYARSRRQFGRAIGSFQAVKHACADMLVERAVSEELCTLAVEDLATSVPDADVSIARAKSHVCEAAIAIAGKAMQLHGGFGYTWESGLHASLKRALLNRSLFGSSRAHRRHLARRLVAAG